ncbi:MAG: VWA domain-containing protein [Proteobacteria bacterium]|nr:VWA domain-containing protein [Pseudomonadota bacterium]
MTKSGDPRALEASRSGGSAVDAFVRDVGSLPARRAAGSRGRLLFAMDATTSREPTWDHACAIQGEMFVAAGSLGGLDVRLAFYRGFEEFKVSRWTSEGRELARLMSSVRCLAGRTQIGRLLRYAADQRRESRIDAVVFVGDCCEEDVDQVGHEAGQLGLLGLPVFVFQEGNDRAAARLFPQIARLTKGAYCRFDRSSADELKRLLGAVAAYAAGGRDALLKYGKAQGGAAAFLTGQIK